MGIISAFVARPVATADFTGMGVRPGEKAAATPADTIMRELFIGPDFSSLMSVADDVGSRA